MQVKEHEERCKTVGLCHNCEFEPSGERVQRDAAATGMRTDWHSETLLPKDSLFSNLFVQKSYGKMGKAKSNDCVRNRINYFLL